ncbi:MAG: response regulator transcription factor [Hydrococcus sp. C42_A2020_068]|uniref:response regulator n=1 Tax=Pleurocapsa sp. PCC 7327 TaxID=118163 RepID=UPI00029FF8B1|nr:response regulator transcription factor [Pleurocapsa sp. PCC 7327]AFY79192.1 response regulator containing a CheY-like receiver domain and an HTH DNA-binding domain [Pleurocapsa sp. PCC 7327]MBF2020697.1 response regulator transcription factor [Hydrococcus sp. C42_A2020_068]
MIRILIVDDLLSIREILTEALAVEPDFQIVGTACDGVDAIEKVDCLRPDVVLMDVEMPKMDGLNATQIISQQWRQVKVLILTVHECEEYFDRAVQVGAKGYFLKTTPTEDLVRAIRYAAQGYFQLPFDLVNKYLSKLVEVQATFNELASLKQVIQTQLEQCKQFSYLSGEKCLQIEQELHKQQKTIGIYFHQSQIEQDWHRSQVNQHLVHLKKDLLGLRRTLWVLIGILLSLLSFGLALGVTLWLKRS